VSIEHITHYGKIIKGLTLKIDKLDSYLNDYYLDTDDNVYLFFKWILDMKEYIMPNRPQENLILWSYNSYLEHIKVEDTDIIREQWRDLMLFNMSVQNDV